MDFNEYRLWLLIGGVIFSALGAAAVFSNRFRKAWWGKGNESEIDKMLFSGKRGYYFDRYGRGLGALTLGVMMLLALWLTYK
jgi:hypothetical protein